MGVAWCTGSGYVVRRNALDEIGQIPIGSVAEDVLTSTLLLGAGWKTVYVHEPLQYGTVPDSYGSHIKQRTRWVEILCYYMYRSDVDVTLIVIPDRRYNANSLTPPLLPWQLRNPQPNPIPTHFGLHVRHRLSRQRPPHRFTFRNAGSFDIRRSNDCICQRRRFALADKILLARVDLQSPE